MEASAAEHEDARESDHDQKRNQDYCGPTEFSLP